MFENDIFIAILASFIISTISSIFFIPMLRKLKMGQYIRTDGPKTHMQKAGTPTIGGIIIFAGLILVGAFFGSKYELIYPLLFFTFGCGLIGFFDDYIKVTQRRSLGLTALQKMIALILISVIFTLYVNNFAHVDSELIIPFLSQTTFDLKALFVPFTVFFILATVNSVNLTDGLDGLASGITIIISIFFVIVSLRQGNMPIAVFSGLLAGSTLGFFTFNIHPAKVIMGDTGSLALGAAISAIAIMLKMPLFIIIVGGIFLVETLSVIIQVSSYKLRGKRVFKMTPIHHHFELSGWRETKVVMTFWVVTGVLNVIGYFALL